MQSNIIVCMSIRKIYSKSARKVKNFMKFVSKPIFGIASTQFTLHNFSKWFRTHKCLFQAAVRRVVQDWMKCYFHILVLIVIHLSKTEISRTRKKMMKIIFFFNYYSELVFFAHSSNQMEFYKLNFILPTILRFQIYFGMEIKF